MEKSNEKQIWKEVRYQIMDIIKLKCFLGTQMAMSNKQLAI